MVHDADPPDPDSFGPRRQPQILNRTTGAVEIRIPHCGPSEDRPASAPPVAGHAEIHRRLFDAFEFKTPIEVGARSVILHRRLIIDPAKDRFHGALGPWVTHDHEVPGLHEADRPRMVRRSEQSEENLVRNGNRQEVSADVPALENGAIDRVTLVPGKCPGSLDGMDCRARRPSPANTDPKGLRVPIGSMVCTALSARDDHISAANWKPWIGPASLQRRSPPVSRHVRGPRRRHRTATRTGLAGNTGAVVRRIPPQLSLGSDR